jgi:hypothetical protein
VYSLEILRRSMRVCFLGWSSSISITLTISVLADWIASSGVFGVSKNEYLEGLVVWWSVLGRF